MSATRFSYILTLVFAIYAPQLAASSYLPHAPVKGASAGCTDSCDPGDNFNHYTDGLYNGAISKVCVNLGSVKAIHSHDWITGITVCYAGRCVAQGVQANTDCLELGQFEYITTVSGTGNNCVPRGADHPGVSSINITTNLRSKAWAGRTCGDPWTLSSPSNRHITSFYGRASGGHIGWGGMLNQIGVYYDSGMAAGEWVPLPGSGPGTGTHTYKYSACTTASSSTKVSESSEWTHSTQTELSLGFEFEGLKEGGSRQVTDTYAHTMATESATSLSTTTCNEATWTCQKDTDYAWQWVYSSNFDQHGTAGTHTNFVVCSKGPEVCCLPQKFLHGDPTKCVKGSPNLCVNSTMVQVFQLPVE